MDQVQSLLDVTSRENCLAMPGAGSYDETSDTTTQAEQDEAAMESALEVGQDLAVGTQQRNGDKAAQADKQIISLPLSPHPMIQDTSKRCATQTMMPFILDLDIPTISLMDDDITAFLYPTGV